MGRIRRRKRCVKAWVVPNAEDNTKYDLYIGAKDGVIANEDSSYLFYNFIGMKTVDFQNNFDTINTTNMSLMFCDCLELTILDLSNFDTNNVTDMYGMFWATAMANPMKIETIIFGEKFKTNNVTNMQWMFANCDYLEELDLSTFNTSEVTNMYGMFVGCKSLETLNLCSFNTSKVTNMSGIFERTTNLTVIYVGPNWTSENANTAGMFNKSGVSSVTTGQC